MLPGCPCPICEMARENATIDQKLIGAVVVTQSIEAKILLSSMCPAHQRALIDCTMYVREENNNTNKAMS
jgi:hypothetical protein